MYSIFILFTRKLWRCYGVVLPLVDTLYQNDAKRVKHALKCLKTNNPLVKRKRKE